MTRTRNLDGCGRNVSNTIGGLVDRLHPCALGAGVAVVLLGLAPEPAKAINLYDGSGAGNNLEINLTTTLEYAGIYRVNNPSTFLVNPAYNPTGFMGDAAFQHGLVSNLFDVLPVLDAQDGDYGAHVSGELYLNTVYLQKNQDNFPGGSNSFGSGTRNVNGENARLLDAFVYGAEHFGAGDEQTISLKFGRQTLLWGQSLFFPGNGIAAGMAPDDAVIAQTQPNAETQQVILPVGQAVLTYSPNSSLTFQGYYQFEWQHTSFQGVGAYFSTTDLLGASGQSLEGIPPGKALTPPINNGQFGLSVQGTLGSYDLGLYALRYDAKTPTLYIDTSPLQFRFVYPRDIQIYGASIGTTILGDAGPQVSAEISGRRNMPLLGSGAAFSTPANPGNANSNPLYPVGDTWAAQASTTYVSPGIPLDPGGVTIAGEIAYNHLITVTKNRAALATGRQASAAAFQFVVTPAYYDVFPHLTVSFPIGIGYNLLGRSEIDPTMQHGTGSFNIGVTGTYRTNWIASLTYVDYLGKPDATYNAFADRGYVSLTLQHSF